MGRSERSAPSNGKRTFEEIALPHLEAVYRVARRLTRHEHEAEDLVQETYLKGFRAFAKFEMREYGIKPWLLKILHNTFLNRRVRENRAPKAIDDKALEQSQAAAADASRLPGLDYEQLDEEVKQAIDGLQPEYRSVLLLWATMELSYREIADILKVPIGTVMSRLHRARQQLTKVLDEYAKANRLVSENPQ
jgi:RNA polymerase sigma-70 factor (ECF subfamily)